MLRRIIADKQVLSNALHFVLETAFPYPENCFGQDVLVGLNVRREMLNLLPGRKPGDIDLLIVPFKNGLLLDRTIAVEVKIVRPTIQKPSRNVNSMGLHQTLGLLDDGFPFVGLLHVVVPEPLPVQWHWRVPLKSLEADEHGQPKDTGEFILFDPFPRISVQRHEGRLRALPLPSEVAYKSIAFTLSQCREKFTGWHVGEERSGQRNPRTSSHLLECVAAFVEQSPEHFRHIRWFE